VSGNSFSPIEMGKRGLQAHTQAISTTGHNITNANTAGYSRQRVEFKPTDPLYLPQLNRDERPGMMGQGVDVVSVTRVRDMLLEQRIVSSAHGEGYWSARDTYILMLEQAHNEPQDISLRARLDAYWSAWQELSLHPEQSAARRAVVQRSNGLMDAMKQKYSHLRSIADMINQEVEVTVTRINELSRQIADLNVQIMKSQALGDSPNDLMDLRDLKINELSTLVPVTIDDRDKDEFRVHTGGIHLVQGGVVSPLEIRGNSENEGYWDVYHQRTNQAMPLYGGRLAALVELRDVDTRGEIQKLNTLAVHVMDLTNEVHRAAWSMNGERGLNFFREEPFVLTNDGSYDRNGDGELDSSYIFRVTGVNRLQPQEKVGIQGQIRLSGPQEDVVVEYYPTDTVQDIVNRINLSGAEVTARLDREGKLTLRATTAQQVNNPDFVIRRIEDSGQFLVGYAGILATSGAEGAFDWTNPQAVTTLRGGPDGQAATWAVAPLSHPSRWFEVNSQIQADPSKIAAGFGVMDRPAELGDGTAAMAIANLRNTPVMIGRSKTFDDYFSDTVAAIGLKGEIAKISLKTEQTIMKDLRDMREKLSGVNLDEEFANLIKFQHGFAATARFISQIDSMLDIIINRLKV